MASTFSQRLRDKYGPPRTTGCRLSLGPSEREKLGLERIEGLQAWLSRADLQSRGAEVERWSIEMGAVSLEQVQGAGASWRG